MLVAKDAPKESQWEWNTNYPFYSPADNSYVKDNSSGFNLANKEVNKIFPSIRQIRECDYAQKGKRKKLPFHFGSLLDSLLDEVITERVILLSDSA